MKYVCNEEEKQKADAHNQNQKELQFSEKIKRNNGLEYLTLTEHEGRIDRLKQRVTSLMGLSECMAQQ